MRACDPWARRRRCGLCGFCQARVLSVRASHSCLLLSFLFDLRSLAACGPHRTAQGPDGPRLCHISGSSRRNQTPRADPLRQETLPMRNRIERVIGHLKTDRALATRYDQLAESFFLGMLYLAAARYWIKFVRAA